MSNLDLTLTFRLTSQKTLADLRCELSRMNISGELCVSDENSIEVVFQEGSADMPDKNVVLEHLKSKGFVMHPLQALLA